MAITGLYSDTGTRRFGSAEAQALRGEGLDESEIRQVLVQDEHGLVIETDNGRIVCLSLSDAQKVSRAQH